MASILQDYRNILLGAHRNVRLFFLASFLSQLGNGFFAVLYNLYIKSMGLPDTVAGSYVSAGALASTLSLIPAGIISGRFGRRRSVLGAGFFNALVMMGQAFVHVPWMIVSGSFIASMFSAVSWVSVLPLLAENTAKEDRFHLFSVNFGLGLLAQVLGSMLSGVVSDTFTMWMSPTWSIRGTLLCGALIVFCALIPYSRIQESRRLVSTVPQSQARGLSARLSTTMAQIKTNQGQIRLIAKFSFASMWIGFGAGLVIPYLNLYFSDRFHMTKAEIGIVIGLAQACTAMAIILGPAMAKRIGPVKAAVSFQLASIPFLLTTAYATSPWFASGAVVIRNALMNCASPIQDSIMMALVSENLRSLAVSSGQTLWSLGWAVMGPISTHIVHHYGAYTGYAIVFSGTALLYLIGSGYYFLAFRRHEAEVSEEAA